MGKGSGSCTAPAIGLALTADPSDQLGVSEEELAEVEALAEEIGFTIPGRFQHPELHEEAFRALLWHHKGWSYEEISSKLDLSENTIVRYVRAVKKVALSEIEQCEIPDSAPAWVHDALAEYHLEGRSLSEIAKRKGVSKETVRRWMIKSKINRRPAAEGRPTRYVRPDPKDKALFRAVKEARANAEQLRSSGNATAAREMTAAADRMEASRHYTSYVEDGPFANPAVMERMSAELLSMGQATGGPVAMFQWEEVTARAYSEHYDDAYVMEEANNAGRDVEVVDGKKIFGVSNKSESHAKVGASNAAFRIRYFMVCDEHEDFGSKALRHISDYEDILNIRTFEGTFPGSDQPARCYRVYNLPKEIFAEVAAKCPDLPPGRSKEVLLDSGHVVKVSNSEKGKISFPKIPMELARYQAAFWEPLEKPRGGSGA